MFKKKTKFVISSALLLLFCLVLTSCGERLSFEEKKELRDFVRTYKPAFKQKVALQYGKKAKLKNIHAQVYWVSDSVWPISHEVLGDNLEGKISVDGETFNVMYVVADDEIITQRNAEKIEKSAKDIFESKGMDILKISVRDSGREHFWLTDDIADLPSLVNSGNSPFINVAVKNDLSKFSKEDFEWLFSQEDVFNKKFDGFITFVQLNDTSETDELMSDLINGTVSFYHDSTSPTIYSSDAGGDVDAFEYFDLQHSIFVRVDESGLVFHYKDKNKNEDTQYINFPEPEEPTIIRIE